MNLNRLEDYPWFYDRTAPPIDPHYEFLSSHKTLDAFEVGGLKFVCPPGIYHPTEFSSTRFMYRGVFNELPRFGQRVLDIGTGCGALGICLAAAGRAVTMLDIDPLAVACAANNAVLNRVDVQVLQSDLFEAVPEEKYDLILFNIPLLDKEVESQLEVIACDTNGRLFTRFMHEARHHLTANGAVCVSISNLGHREAILAALVGYQYRILYSEYYSGDNIWKCLLLARPI
jgi:HemK-related putative methylase